MFVSPAQLAFHAGQYYFHKKVTMPYLRGSFKKPTYKKASLENKVARLQRQVGRNTAGKEYFRNSVQLVAIGSGYNSQDIDLTQSIISNARFRDVINGDRWYNRSINFRSVLFPDVSACRFVLYSCKKASTFFNPATSAEGFTTPLDPAAFTVYKDFYVTMHDQTERATINENLSLRSLMTIYNDSSTVLEKGQIRIHMMWYDPGTTGGSINGNAHWQLCVQDK